MTFAAAAKINHTAPRKGRTIETENDMTNTTTRTTILAASLAAGGSGVIVLDGIPIYADERFVECYDGDSTPPLSWEPDTEIVYLGYCNNYRTLTANEIADSEEVA